MAMKSTRASANQVIGATPAYELAASIRKREKGRGKSPAGNISPIVTQCASGQQSLEGLAHCANPDQLALPRQLTQVRRVDVGLRHDAAAESHLSGLANAQRRLRDAAHLAREPHLAKHRRRRGDDAIAHA